MKKWFPVILWICLLLTLCACSEKTAEASAAPVLQVGYGRTVITPEQSMPMRGYANALERFSKEVLDDLYATCIAFTDGDGNTILLFHTDLCTTYGEVAPFIRKAIEEKTGVPYGNIMISATHTHSGPELSVEHGSVQPYKQLLQERMVEAAVTAMADRKDAQMYVASTELVGMNFVRHYIMDDGSVVGDNFGDTEGKSYVRHVSEADNVMQLVRFKRNGGSDVVLCNWQTHPHRAGSADSKEITSDIVGSMRSYVEENTGAQFAYFSGASGNINPSSRINSENLTSDYLEQGREMGRHAVLALEGAKWLGTGKVQILGENQTVQAENGKMDVKMEMYAFSVGDLAFVAAPYEMFDINGKYIKNNSPFPMTFVVTYANTVNGYVAAKNAYVYGGYEVEYKNYVVGTAESLAENYVGMLNKLHETKVVYPAADADAGAATLYWNLSQGAEHTPDGDGNFTLSFLKDGQQVTYKIKDAQLLAKIDRMQLMSLTLDGEMITGVTGLEDLSYHRLCDRFYVQSMGGRIVKANSDKRMNGKEVVVETSDDVKVYDVSALAECPGVFAQLQKNDGISVVANEDGKAVSIFITERAALLENEKKYCKHCDRDVQWFSWHSDSALPTSTGHYYLTKDVNLSGTTITAEAEICLDLNGKTVKQHTDGERIYYLRGATKMSVMDGVGTGTWIPSSTADSPAYTYKWGMIFEMVHDDCELNIYGGTMDASAATAQYGVAINCVYGTINLYDGLIKGGTGYGTGSSAIRAGDIFNMYGGTIIGGTNPDVGFKSINIHGGATLRVGGYTTIYGGEIIGGYSDFDGGIAYVDGTLKMLGGSLSGGECKGVGGGVFITENGRIVLGGDAQIIGNTGTNLYLKQGATVEIHENGLSGAKIGISSAVDGVFASGKFSSEDASCFVSDVPGVRVMNTDKGLALK